MSKYAVCIATDIMRSRTFNDEYITSFLRKTAEDLNNKYEKTIITPFQIRNGDEIIGALSRFSDGYKVFKDIYCSNREDKLKMYIGIGFGTIGTRDVENIHKVNGTAIRSAIEARDRIKDIKSRSKDYPKIFDNFKYTRYFAYAEKEIFPVDVINHYINYVHEKIDNRTPKQIEIIKMIENNPMLSQEEIATKYFDYRDSSGLSKQLSRADYYIVKDAQENLVKLLDFIQEEIEESNDE